MVPAGPGTIKSGYQAHRAALRVFRVRHVVNGIDLVFVRVFVRTSVGVRTHTRIGSIDRAHGCAQAGHTSAGRASAGHAHADVIGAA